MRGSSLPDEVAVSPRLNIDLVAQALQYVIGQFCKGRVPDLGCCEAPRYALYKPLAHTITCADWPNSFHPLKHVDLDCDLLNPLPLPDRGFDSIILTDVLEHISTPRELLAELYRVLKIGGVVIGSVPFLYRCHEEPHDYHRYTSHAIRRMADACGFEVLVLRPYGAGFDVVCDMLAEILVDLHWRIGPMLAGAVQRLGATMRKGRYGSILTAERSDMPLGYVFVLQRTQSEVRSGRSVGRGSKPAKSRMHHTAQVSDRCCRARSRREFAAPPRCDPAAPISGCPPSRPKSMPNIAVASDHNIIVLAPNPWLGQWVNRQQLFSRLGKQHNVLYSCGGWHTWDRGSEDWQAATWGGAFQRCNDVWVDMPPKALTRIPRLPLLDKLALRLQVRRWKQRLGAQGNKPLVAYVFHPMFLPYVRALDADFLVYHAYDKYDHMPNWTPELEAGERYLAQHADLVVAASQEMADGLRAKGASQVHHLPNGAYVQAFMAAVSPTVPEPDDLRAIPRPRLGWVGSLHPQVDYAMLAELAVRRSAWHFVLVGDPSPQADARAEADRALCRTRRNIHFLGGRPIDSVPLYVSKMDVNMMCYRLADQDWIRAIYPLKLHEYLAAGHPVVSADVPSVRPFADVVRIAHGVDDWEAALDDALQRGGQGTVVGRQAVAAANSWDHRVATLGGWLAAMVQSTASRRAAVPPVTQPGA